MKLKIETEGRIEVPMKAVADIVDFALDHLEMHQGTATPFNGRAPLFAQAHHEAIKACAEYVREQLSPRVNCAALEVAATYLARYATEAEQSDNPEVILAMQAIREAARGWR